ncbi:MAG TPA: hypothetical protein VF708_18040 [Pyrinomonadaceae bacterium]
MKTAIFLGAGASAAEGAPVQSKLFERYFESVSRKYQAMNNELATFFNSMFNIDVTRMNDREINFPTFEEALGILDLAELRRESLKDFHLELSSSSQSINLLLVRQYLVLAMAMVIADTLGRSRGQDVAQQDRAHKTHHKMQ